VCKVLRNGLLRYILHTCPNLWFNSCSKCYGMDPFMFHNSASCVHYITFGGSGRGRPNLDHIYMCKIWKFYLVTFLPFYPLTFSSFILLRFYPFTLLRFFPFTLLILYASTLLRFYVFTPLRFYASTLVPFYVFTLLRFYAFTLLPRAVVSRKHRKQRHPGSHHSRILSTNR